MKYYMLRLWNGEQIACSDCCDLIFGTNEKPSFVYVKVKRTPDLPGKDELDVFCEECFEKDEEIS